MVHSDPVLDEVPCNVAVTACMLSAMAARRQSSDPHRVSQAGFANDRQAGLAPSINGGITLGVDRRHRESVNPCRRVTRHLVCSRQAGALGAHHGLVALTDGGGKPPAFSLISPRAKRSWTLSWRRSPPRKSRGVRGRWAAIAPAPSTPARVSPQPLPR